MIFALRILMLIVASSYVTMGLFASDRAEQLWWPYALAQFVLTLSTTLGEVVRKAKHHDG